MLGSYETIEGHHGCPGIFDQTTSPTSHEALCVGLDEALQSFELGLSEGSEEPLSSLVSTVAIQEDDRVEIHAVN